MIAGSMERLEMSLSLLLQNLEVCHLFQFRAFTTVFSTCVCLMGLLEGKTFQLL